MADPVDSAGPNFDEDEYKKTKIKQNQVEFKKYQANVLEKQCLLFEEGLVQRHEEWVACGGDPFFFTDADYMPEQTLNTICEWIMDNSLVDTISLNQAWDLAMRLQND